MVVGMSFGQLLRHDLRLSWRDLRGAFRIFGRRGFIAMLAVVVLVMHAAGWAAMQRLDAAQLEGAGAEERLVAFGVAFVLLLMIAQSLNGATQALYGRGDLDLLVSSPLSARRLLLVRALAIACNAAVSAAIFVVPLADAGALFGDWRRLAMLPVLGCGALGAVAVGLTVAVALFALLGPKRARLGAQILATFIGGGFMLALQVNRVLPRQFSAEASGWMTSTDHHAGILDLPVAATLGQPGPLLWWCLGCIVLFAVTTLALGPRFIDQAMVASAAEATLRVTRHRHGSDRAFSTGRFTAIRRKEWRIVLRDPWIVSQILLQLLYITPLFAVLWQTGDGRGSPVLALASTVVVVSYQLAASLTWLGVSGEDAPELMQCAPVPEDSIRRGKVQAVAGLTAVVTGPLLLWLVWLSPGAAARTLALCCFAGLAAVALNLWHARPARRGSFAARHRESKLLALVEMVMSMLLGILAALVAVGSPWLAVPLTIIALILLANRPRQKLTTIG